MTNTSIMQRLKDMSENISIKNGGSFNLPLALVLFIALETGGGIWILSRLVTQVEMLTQQVNIVPLANEQFRKNQEDKTELLRLQIERDSKELVAIRTKLGMK